MITKYPWPVEEAMRYTFFHSERTPASICFPHRRPSNSDMAALPTSLNSSIVIEGPLSAGLNQLRHPDLLLPPH